MDNRYYSRENDPITSEMLERIIKESGFILIKKDDFQTNLKELGELAMKGLNCKCQPKDDDNSVPVSI